MNVDDHAERISRRELLTGLAGAALAGVSGCEGGAPVSRGPARSAACETIQKIERVRDPVRPDPVLNVRARWASSGDTVDPFLFCVHHDDAYPAGNEQLGPASSLAGRDIGQDFAGIDGWRMYHGDVVPGFPQHPHRGFETVTVVRKGLIDHSDSLGATARYGHGDTQWLTAGAGIVHAEMFPLVQREAGNPLELFQIWLNLPKANKFAAPYFSMLWREATPVRVEQDSEGRATAITVIAGDLADTRPLPPPPDSWAARADSDVAIWSITMAPGARWTLPPALVGSNRTLYFYRGAGIRVAGARSWRARGCGCGRRRRWSW
jgi:redox-sensitive bicupin YhaK (pirin superfamily)